MKAEFYASGREEWRGWLAENHANATEVWLELFKKHTDKPSPSYNDAVEEALCFGWVDSTRRNIDKNRYAFKFTPRKPGSKWSPSNIARVEKLIKMRQMTPAGMKLVEAAKTSGAWDNPITPPTFEMPPEFRKALAENQDAEAFFETLPPSQKKQYIGWIASAKREETRAKRLKEALKLLTANQRLGVV